MSLRNTVTEASRIAALVAGYVAMGIALYNWDKEPYTPIFIAVYMFAYAGFHNIKINGLGISIEAEKEENNL